MPGRQILTVTGQGELRRLARDCRNPAIPREIRESLRKELLAVARGGAAEVRAAVLATPSKGQNARRGKRPLRRKIASATEAKVRVSTRPGAIIWTNPGRMPAGEQNLPAYYEGLGRGRHPTFGIWSRTQTGTARAFPIVSHPYFYRTLDRIGPSLVAAGDRVLSDVANRIE